MDDKGMKHILFRGRSDGVYMNRLVPPTLLLRDPVGWILPASQYWSLGTMVDSPSLPSLDVPPPLPYSELFSPPCLPALPLCHCQG